VQEACTGRRPAGWTSGPGATRRRAGAGDLRVVSRSKATGSKSSPRGPGAWLPERTRAHADRAAPARCPETLV